MSITAFSGFIEQLFEQQPDVFPLIFGYCNSKDINQFSKASRLFRSIVENKNHTLSFMNSPIINADIIRRYGLHEKSPSFSHSLCSCLNKIDKASSLQLRFVDVDSSIEEISNSSSQTALNLSNLRHLEFLKVQCHDVTSIQVKGPKLREITLILPNLVQAPDFSNLVSLKTVDTSLCEKLRSVPNVTGCSALEKKSFYIPPQNHPNYTFAADN
jgi:hypothetical protein